MDREGFQVEVRILGYEAGGHTNPVACRCVKSIITHDTELRAELTLTQSMLRVKDQNAAWAAGEVLRQREALERIFMLDKCPSPGDGCSQCIARDALESRDKREFEVSA